MDWRGVYRRGYDWVDARLGIDQERHWLGKSFPDEDSFLLGEVALFTFVALVLTGIFLAYFYQPSTAAVEYQGAVDQYQGQEHPSAFVSVLEITYDVPFGMFIRRLHHWAAHFFMAAIALHMLRVFFTGAYRNPREPNWLIGTGLAIAAMFAGFTGYVLPYDNFAAEAASIGHVVADSVPVLGGTIADLVFGGDFPTAASIPRMYFIHVFVLPALIAGLVGAHMFILLRQKHTEAPREDDDSVEVVAASEGSRARPLDADDDSVVIGLPAVPNQTAVTAVVFFLTFAVLALLTILPVHNVAAYGPYDPSETPGLIMPDWYLMWMFGFLKLLPGWLELGPISTEFIAGALLPGLLFFAVAVWPFVDYEPEPVHFTADPLSPERAWQTATGVAGVVFIMLLSLGGMNNLAAELVGMPAGRLNPILLGLSIVGPIAAWLVTYVTLGGRSGDGEEPGGQAPGDPDEAPAAGGGDD